MSARGTASSNNPDLDINLIMLYSKCEAFYNKRHPYYRDKIYTEQAWVHISQKLGYKVDILKDRIVLLRNRFNLEKRKVDNWRSEDNPNPASSWPLYKYMTFLIGHVRQRKTIKMLQKMREQAAMNGSMKTSKSRATHRKFLRSDNAIQNESNNSNTNNNSNINNNHNGNNNTNLSGRGGGGGDLVGHMMDGNTSEATKLEYNSDIDDDDSVQIMDDMYDDNIDIRDMNGNHIDDNDSHIPDILMTTENGENILGGDGGDNDGNELKNQGGMGMGSGSGGDHFDGEDSDRQMPRMYRQSENLDYAVSPKMMPMLYSKEEHTRTNKYNSFGHFIATSLCDMPDDKALDLMQKFSMDIINAMRSSIL